MKAKGVAHAGKGKSSLSSGEANENERRGWNEDSYRRKNETPWNNYDWSRHRLNFEIVKGKVLPLGSQSVSLYNRYQNLVKSLDFHQYKENAANQQHTYVELILSGSTEKMQKLAFGDQQVDFTRNPENWRNWNVTRTKAIEEWAMDCYRWCCQRYGEENIIGFEVHLDETEPHIHVNIVPTAIMQQRGNVSGYHKVDADGNPVTYTKGKHIGEVIKISAKKYNALSEEKKKEYRPNVRGTVRTISYATYFGRTLEERSKKGYELHDEFHEHVGKKWGFDRGDVWALLPEEERGKRGRKTKKQAYEIARQEAAIRENVETLTDQTLDIDNKMKRISEMNDKLDNKKRELKRLENDVNSAKQDLNTTQEAKDAAQQQLELISKVTNLMEHKVADYVHALPDVGIAVTAEIRNGFLSPLKSHPRIINSINPEMTIEELTRVAEEEIGKVIKDKSLFLSKEDREKKVNAIMTDMTTILFQVVGDKQRSEIAEAQKKLYKEIRSEMADAASKAIKYDEMEKAGITVSSYEEAKETADRMPIAEDTLEFAWPGITKAKNVLVNSELNERKMTEKEKKDVFDALREEPDLRIQDTLKLLNYASSFRRIPLKTQANVLIDTSRTAVEHIKNLGYDLVAGAKA